MIAALGEYGKPTMYKGGSGSSSGHSNSVGGGGSAPGQGNLPPGSYKFGHDPNYPDFPNFATQWDAEQHHLQWNFDWDDWNNKLNSAEREGIYRYTSYWYSDINTFLREGVRPTKPEVYQWIMDAKTGLDKYETTTEHISFRGANLHWTANLLGGTEAQMSDPNFLKSRIGKTFVDAGFMSSGTHKSSSWQAAVNYKIYVNIGTHGMYVDPISANSGEKEFLFNSGTAFKVLEIVTNSSGRITDMVLETVT